MISRYWYSHSRDTRDAADLDIEDGMASGDISRGEFPEIKTYIDGAGKKRYGVTIGEPE